MERRQAKKRDELGVTSREAREEEDLPRSLGWNGRDDLQTKQALCRMNRKSCSSFVPEEDPAIRERMTGRCGQRRACKGSGGDRSGRGDVILDVSDVSVGPGAVRAGSCQPASRAVGPLLPVPRLPQLPGARSRRRAAQPQPGNDFT